MSLALLSSRVAIILRVIWDFIIIGQFTPESPAARTVTHHAYIT
jgi:hypothetical protein